MSRFLCFIGWQLFVLWLAIGIGFSLQVIDKTIVLATDADVCRQAGVVQSNGHCRFTARAEGNFDKTWTFTPAGEAGHAITVDGLRPTLYQPNDWHMTGGAFSGIALTLLALVLSGFPPGVELWRIWRKNRMTMSNA